MKIHHSALVSHLHSLFYGLSFTYVPPLGYRAFFWAVEKCLLLGILMLPLFHETPWANANAVIVNLNLLKRFPDANSGFSTVCFVIFALFQLFLIIAIYKLVRQQAVPEFVNWIVSLGMAVVHSVYVHVVTLITCFLYLVLLRGSDAVFSEQKGISGAAIVGGSMVHLILCALFGLLFLQVLVVDCAAQLFTQEDKMTLRCTRKWKFKMLDLLAKLAVVAIFVMDIDENYIIIATAGLGFLFAAKIVLFFWSPLALRDVPDYAYDSCAMLIASLTAAMHLLGEDAYYQYSVFIPIFAALFCVVRLLVFFFPQLNVELKTADGILDYLRMLVELCNDKDKSSMLRMYGLLEVHRQNCTRPGCECFELAFLEVARSWGDPVKFNYRTYETDAELPECVAKCYKFRLLNILINDVKSIHIKSTEVSLALAEICYYLFANQYQALLHVQSVESATNSIVDHQFTTNLRCTIEAGINKTSEETVTLLTALNFQNEYGKFLSCIEYSSECTIKFWATLLDESPNPAVLTDLGHKIYDTSQTLFALVKGINQSSPDNLEFLVKFGLYSKHILHDKGSANYAFQRIIYNSENASFGTRKDQVMTLVVSLEQHNFFAILEVNTELEHRFGFKREKLVGLPASRLMHSTIAKHHQEIMQKFFQTMHTTKFCIEKTQFLRHQEGYVIPCKGMKKMVPHLGEGLKGMLLLYHDPTMSSYTAQRLDRTKKRTGAFLCDKKLAVTEYTKEVFEELGLRSEILLSGAVLQNIFPELLEDALVEQMSRPQGAVLIFNALQANDEINHELVERLRIKGCVRGNGSTALIDSIAPTGKFLWVRLIREKCGTDDLVVFLFSPIMKYAIGEYKASPQFGGRLFERSESPLTSKELLDKTPTTCKVTENIYAEDELEIASNSRASSVGSMSSIGSITSQQEMYMHEEMQQGNSGANVTPTIVRRLALVLISFFGVVITLVTMETITFYTETESLMGRFQMIEYFNIRYALIIYMSACPMSYDSYRRSTDAVNFVSYCYRARYRANRAAYYNVLLKKSFAKFNINYDYENVLVQSDGDYYSVSFNYALLNYINEIMTYTDLNDYYISRSCVGNYSTPICIENNDALDYCKANGIYTMRPYQGKISVELTAELLRIALSGRDELYILMSVCIAVVILSSFFILVLLIWVIKDKSNVMAIFAEITMKEIDGILVKIRGLNIVETHFDQRFVRLCEGSEDRFWKYLDHPHRGTPSADLVGVMGSRSSLLVKSPDQGKPRPTPSFSVLPILAAAGADRFKQRKGTLIIPAKNGKGEEEEEGKEEEKLAAEEKKRREHEERKLKRGARRGVLSQIDSSLRNRSTIKLGGVLLFFLLYGCGSLYFNYYVHDFNNTTTSFFYELTKRNTYATSIGLLMREAVRVRNKNLLQYSGDPDNMYMMDYIDGAWEVESIVKDYNTRTADARIFKNYLALSERLDTSEFCNLVDGYQVGQSGYCNTSYVGPQLQGLTAGIAYYLTYHVVFSSKIMNTDLTNDTIANAMEVSADLLTPWAKTMIYLQSGIEQQMVAYRVDSLSFYNTVKTIIVAKAACFAVLFMGMYVVVFIGLLNTLKSEIWFTKGMIRMIPIAVVDSNKRVQKLIYKRKRGL